MASGGLLAKKTIFSYCSQQRCGYPFETSISRMSFAFTFSRTYRAALDSSSLRADETLGGRHLSWAAPQAHHTYLNESLLPARLVRNHAWALLAPSPDELRGYRRARQSPQRRADSPARAPAPKDNNRHARRQIKTSRKTRTQSRFGFDPPALEF
jgi:hypothetical protein